MENGSDIAEGLFAVAHQLRDLGLAGAAPPGGGSFGAIELLAKEVKEGTERLSDALCLVADAIRERD